MLPVDSELTMHENMADVLGVEMALKAYRLSEHYNADRLKLLPDLPSRTVEQMFFIGLGRTIVYCNSEPPLRLLETVSSL